VTTADALTLVALTALFAAFAAQWRGPKRSRAGIPLPTPRRPHQADASGVFSNTKNGTPAIAKRHIVRQGNRPPSTYFNKSDSRRDIDPSAGRGRGWVSISSA
jgi:hypothetical protein